MARLETHLRAAAAMERADQPGLAGEPRRRLGPALADSAQLWRLRPPGARLWLDLGSGAGFPGLVVAAIAGGPPGLHVHLVESDQRKAAFLGTVVRATGVAATVHAERVEALPPMGADVVSARALAPLDDPPRHGGKAPAAGGNRLVSQGRVGA